MTKVYRKTENFQYCYKVDGRPEPICYPCSEVDVVKKNNGDDGEKEMVKYDLGLEDIDNSEIEIIKN